MSVSLYDAIKASYGNKDSRNKIESSGYKYDHDLSNDNESVFYNPNGQEGKRLLYTVAGTHNLKDWGTDAYLAVGKIKDTNRFKEAQSVYDKAKQKYGQTNAVIAGHSMGGSVAQYVAGTNDKVYGLDKGSSFGQPTRSNEKDYRTAGDAVSLNNMYGSKTTTLSNPNGFLGTLNPIESHNVDNIKNSGINII
jgi:hypothetical protein